MDAAHNGWLVRPGHVGDALEAGVSGVLAGIETGTHQVAAEPVPGRLRNLSDGTLTG